MEQDQWEGRAQMDDRVQTKSGRSVRPGLLCQVASLSLAVTALGCFVPDAFVLPASAQGNPAGSKCQREILDPALGLRWRMVADPEHRTRPARLVLVGTKTAGTGAAGTKAAGTAAAGASLAVCPAGTGSRSAQSISPASPQATAGVSPSSRGIQQETRPVILPAIRPVIQPGDHLIVLQQEDRLLARLPAVALSAAVPGQSIPVRLRIGNGAFGSSSGRVVDAVAMEHGLVRWTATVAGVGMGAAW